MKNWKVIALIKGKEHITYRDAEDETEARDQVAVKLLRHNKCTIAEAYDYIISVEAI